jgi:hypothetical protein
MDMPTSEQPFRKTTIYAPSFSWTAWTEQVRYLLYVGLEYPEACEVVETHSTLTGTNIYGQISASFIKLRGLLTPLAPIHERITLLKALFPYKEDTVLPVWASGDERPNITLDCYRESGWSQVFCFEVLNFNRSDSVPVAYGLVLQETNIASTYTRAGILMNLHKSWIGPTTPREVITLV